MELSQEGLQYFSKFIETEIGIVYSESNFYQLDTRLVEIAKQVGYQDVHTLWQLAKTNQLPGTVKMLILDIATNNETLFFRDQTVFRAIEGLFRNAVTTNNEPFKIWSAACSTGQEMLSMSILRSEVAASQPFQATIVGTDVSKRVLSRAKSGVYSQLEVQRGLTASQLIRYFEPINHLDAEPPQWRAKSELMQGNTYLELNLLQPQYPLGKFDLILCRNVLIYQTVENKRKVIVKLTEHLTPDGILILGGSESLMGISDSLIWEDRGGASIYRKASQTTQKVS